MHRIIVRGNRNHGTVYRRINGACMGGCDRGLVWAYQFLFPRTFFNVKLPPKLELLGTFCAEDGMRALPNTEPIGVADW